METDVDSKVLSRGLERRDTGKTKQIGLQHKIKADPSVGHHIRSWESRGRTEKCRNVLSSLRDLVAKLCYAQSVQYFLLYPRT